MLSSPSPSLVSPNSLTEGIEGQSSAPTAVFGSSTCVNFISTGTTASAVPEIKEALENSAMISHQEEEIKQADGQPTTEQGTVQMNSTATNAGVDHPFVSPSTSSVSAEGGQRRTRSSAAGRKGRVQPPVGKDGDQSNHSFEWWEEAEDLMTLDIKKKEKEKERERERRGMKRTQEKDKSDPPSTSLTAADGVTGDLLDEAKPPQQKKKLTPPPPRKRKPTSASPEMVPSSSSPPFSSEQQDQIEHSMGVLEPPPPAAVAAAAAELEPCEAGKDFRERQAHSPGPAKQRRVSPETEDRAHSPPSPPPLPLMPSESNGMFPPPHFGIPILLPFIPEEVQQMSGLNAEGEGGIQGEEAEGQGEEKHLKGVRKFQVTATGQVIERRLGKIICDHGRERTKCKECGGGSICPHNKLRYTCRQCGKGAKGMCEHNRQRHYCRECGGKSICEHGKRRCRCKECGGRSICQHGRERTKCKACGGRSICAHDRERTKCKECGGGSICVHNRQRYSCKECGGKSICPHKRHKHSCRECVKTDEAQSLPPPMGAHGVSSPPLAAEGDAGKVWSPAAVALQPPPPGEYADNGISGGQTASSPPLYESPAQAPEGS
uniref:Uncharacterized protein n=1 Tax=Chromera velia CCMP2878 TaxID=1169474 RepID=A0A0G4GSN2_9ALVE|eukprot:Cvel_23161.t1-p1 / transcript=Cvel_23161.t1 / gene=Cvel_23161 / organism=Chromera_velia_CCMP2878 / gene_product=Zinc finger protein 571, putative / transcript_product=Zinc finger protein 571, putative / location=Cvel_scaffold2356:24638-27073(+) / protein_length=603 / sequence_SO=supercontig / SO=protein_coding / is_pseudo=false